MLTKITAKVTIKSNKEKKKQKKKLRLPKEMIIMLLSFGDSPIPIPSESIY